MTPAPRRALFAAGALLAPAVARAQPGWPNRPLRCLVGAGPGGTTVIVARRLAPSLSARLGQPVLIENRGGGGGTVASERMAVGGMGFAAYFSDTEGNLIGLWESAEG